MKKSFIRTISVAALGIGSLTALAACGSVKATPYEVGKPVKIGLICLHDDKSTYDANFINAFKEAAKDLGAEKALLEDSCILTGVNEDQACLDAAKDLVKKGCNVVFADSFGHQDYMLEAAKKWPEVQFCHATGTNAKTAKLPNYHNAFASIYQGRYLAGYAAGLKLSISNAADFDGEKAVKVGYVGAFPYAEVKSGYTSWFIGLRNALSEASLNVNKLSMDVEFTNSWYDVNAEQSAAEKLIKGGAILISQHADSMGAPGACEKANIPNVTYNIETKAQCPNTYLAYSRINWAPYYKAVVNAVFDGKGIEGELNNNWTGTLASGSVEYNVNWDNMGKLSDAVAVAAAQVKFTAVAAEIVAGTRQVFDCDNFTKGGQKLTSYKADTDGDFVGDTEVIEKVNGKDVFMESKYCSAPYFDIDIDGINLPQ